MWGGKETADGSPRAGRRADLSRRGDHHVAL